jgi:hypothetical protein
LARQSQFWVIRKLLKANPFGTDLGSIRLESQSTNCQQYIFFSFFLTFYYFVSCLPSSFAGPFDCLCAFDFQVLDHNLPSVSLGVVLHTEDSVLIHDATVVEGFSGGPVVMIEDGTPIVLGIRLFLSLCFFFRAFLILFLCSLQNPAAPPFPGM